MDSASSVDSYEDPPSFQELLRVRETSTLKYSKYKLNKAEKWASAVVYTCVSAVYLKS